MLKLKYFTLCFLFIVITACSSVKTQVEEIEGRCATLLLDSEVVQCYQTENSGLLSRRIASAIRGLTEGDMPHMFQMLIQLQVEYDGKFTVASVVNSSGSRMLDKKVLHTLGNVETLFVPRNRLFKDAGFESLRLLVKPARTPMLEEESLMDKEALVIYVNKIRR